jgi:hypothetical protein
MVYSQNHHPEEHVLSPIQIITHTGSSRAQTYPYNYLYRSDFTYPHEYKEMINIWTQSIPEILPGSLSLPLW